MKRLLALLVACLAFSASAQKAYQLPNQATLSSNSLFITTVDAASGGSRHTSYGQIKAQLQAEITPTNVLTATYATGAGTNVGSIQRLSPVGGWNNIVLDMLDKTPAYDMQVGIARDNNSSGMFFSKGNSGIGSNSWGMPIGFPGGITALGNNSWNTISTNSYFGSYVNSGWFIGYGSNDSRFRATWPNGYGVSSVQPFFSISSANPWMSGAVLCLRGASTNALHGQFKGYNADGIPIYVSQYGLSFQDIGDAVATGTNDLQGEMYQGRPYGSYQILLDEEWKNFFITINGQRPGDSYVGQIPMLVIDTLTKGKTNPVFALPVQRPNAWVRYSTNWIDAFYVDEQYGTAGVYSNLYTGAKIYSKEGVVGQTSIDLGGFIGIDLTNYLRLGFVSKYGSKPMIAGVNSEPIVFAHSDSGSLNVNPIHSQNFTEDLRVNADKSVTFFGDISGPSLTATNYIAMPTNYVAANFAPIAGKVKICVSNGILHTVTFTKTNVFFNAN